MPDTETNVFAIRRTSRPTHKYAYIMLNLITISAAKTKMRRSQNVRYCHHRYMYSKRLYSNPRRLWCTSMNDSIMALWRIIQIFLGLGTDLHSLHRNIYISQWWATVYTIEIVGVCLYYGFKQTLYNNMNPNIWAYKVIQHIWLKIAKGYYYYPLISSSYYNVRDRWD